MKLDFFFFPLIGHLEETALIKINSLTATRFGLLLIMYCADWTVSQR